MVQNGDSYEEYTSEDNKWPGADYVFKEAKCTDNNGALVNDVITFTDGKATLKTNQTIYCTLYFDEKPKSTLEILREKDKEVSGVEHLGPEPGPEPDQVEMYRYQGTDDVPNWILFGTREKCEKDEEPKCTNSKLNNITYDEYVDKYMYRIIGITEEGQMYLLKETFLKEGTTNTFTWNTAWTLPQCLGENCEWPNADLYKRLNGTASNGNPIFVNSTQYEYLKSGDENGTNDGIGSEWYQLITDHNWMYGDTNNTDDSVIYNGDAMYAIETGNTATKRIWPDEAQGQTTCSSDNQCTEKPYTWSKSKNVEAKIGLMYMHDIDYAYANCSSGECIERGNPGSRANFKNSWIFFQKDGYNTTSTYEWLITRFGVGSTSDTYVSARYVERGYVSYGAVLGSGGVRPVFYLSSEAEIADGDGTKSSPFIINLTEDNF